MLAPDGCRHGAEVVHIPFIKGERADSRRDGCRRCGDCAEVVSELFIESLRDNAQVRPRLAPARGNAHPCRCASLALAVSCSYRS